MNNETNLKSFLDQPVKIFMVVAGQLIVYHGTVQSFDDNFLVIKDRYGIDIMLRLSEISQVLKNGVHT